MPGQQIAQGDIHEARLARRVAEDLGIGELRVEGQLQVRMVRDRELRDRRRQLARVHPQVSAQPRRQGRLRPSGGRCHRTQELLESGGELPDVR